MSQQFFDQFAEANLSLQEKLGRSRVTINRDSAVLSTQARSLLQMLNYGLDSITARAASHLLNFDPLHANTAYLMKLCEGLLLNTVEGITPPHLPHSRPLRFQSAMQYKKYSIVGTVGLLDGTPANLVVYGEVSAEPTAGAEAEYLVRYCAGSYVSQSASLRGLDFTPGTLQSVYISEQFKSVWLDSLTVTLHGKQDLLLTPYWSFDDLLSAADLGKAVLVQSTARGLTLTLGDGEVFGGDYNNASTGLSTFQDVSVEYIKSESLSDADPATVAFNKDITTIGDIPLLTKAKTGDTVESMRGRALAEFFAAGKITDERDLEAALEKIPIVKSVHCKREYDYPFPHMQGSTAAFRHAIPEWSEGTKYKPGSLVRRQARGVDCVYLCLATEETTAGLDSPDWALVFEASDSSRRALQRFLGVYPSYHVYDNATLVTSGLVLRSRDYWNESRTYDTGAIVYYPKAAKLYRALAPVEVGFAPDDPVEEGASPVWQEADLSDPEFDDYEEMTQAMFELELKSYFGIWQKLGFVSVVVEPLSPITCAVECKYDSPFSLNQELAEEIAEEVCWRVGYASDASFLNSLLTEKFSLNAVQVTIKYSSGSVGPSQYVRRSGLSITFADAKEKSK